MIDRTDLVAGIVSTACHLTLAVAAWIASWELPVDQPDVPEQRAELVPVPERLPASQQAPMVLPAEATAAVERGETDDAPTELPPLDADDLDFEPQAQRFGTREAPAESGAGAGQDPGHAPALPAAVSPIDELRASARDGAEQAAALERAEAQILEANHFFMGSLRRAWTERWAARFGDRIRNRQLLLLVTVDAHHRVVDLRFVRGTGIDELDSLIQFHIEELARSGRAWGLPPMPNRETREYPFAVTLPR